MNKTEIDCPKCASPLVQQEATYRCAANCSEGGEWALYANRLLVLRPSSDELRRERVQLPWEKPMRRAA